MGLDLLFGLLLRRTWDVGTDGFINPLKILIFFLIEARGIIKNQFRN